MSSLTGLVLTVVLSARILLQAWSGGGSRSLSLKQWLIFVFIDELHRGLLHTSCVIAGLQRKPVG